MSDFRKGKIDLILVTDLSRLSRNMLDFLLLLEEIKKYNTKFLSVKEQFDSEREKKVNRKRDLEDGLPDSVDHTATRDFIHSRWEEFKKGWDKGTGAQKRDF